MSRRGLPDVPAMPVVYENSRDGALSDPATSQAYELIGTKSSIDVPVVAGGRPAGLFGAGYVAPHTFTDSEQRVLLALADRASVAIANAELYERAQQAASLEERQRLARELHDSVSQALYGIALGARTARTQLDRDPTRAVEPVEYVLSLAEAGLTEMRALIFELRPESLESEGLVAALEKQVAATSARYGIDVRFERCEEPDGSLDAKETAYRIAQEALHNVVKHARATHVDLLLACEDSTIELQVHDNGAGFNTDGSFPGHIGLKSMRERAVRIGGTVTIESHPGKGTDIRAQLPLGRGRSPSNEATDTDRIATRQS
jgi:signal transduction histidine kinase